MEEEEEEDEEEEEEEEEGEEEEASPNLEILYEPRKSIFFISPYICLSVITSRF